MNNYLIELFYKFSHKWHSGPPPHVGWWIADYDINEGSYFQWRWWDGKCWSITVTEGIDQDEASEWSTFKEIGKDSLNIEWINYWPKNARVPRI